MNHYLNLLFASRLALPLWDAPAVWLVLYGANHFVGRAVRAANARQHATQVDQHDALTRASQPGWLAAQLLFAAVLFALALLMDGAFGTFLGGGALVQMVCILGMNLQAWWGALPLAKPGASSGTLRLSARYGLQHFAARAGASALTLLAFGLLLPHLALLGGAWLLGAAALGYRRRAAQVPELAAEVDG